MEAEYLTPCVVAGHRGRCPVRHAARYAPGGTSPAEGRTRSAVGGSENLPPAEPRLTSRCSAIGNFPVCPACGPVCCVGGGADPGMARIVVIARTIQAGPLQASPRRGAFRTPPPGAPMSANSAAPNGISFPKMPRNETLHATTGPLGTKRYFCSRIYGVVLTRLTDQFHSKR